MTSTPAQETPRPYGDNARAYLAQGHWPLPLPDRQKAMPPSGYTGHDGKDPDFDTIDEWELARATGNVAIRLPHGVIGIDVDAYDGKPGLATLAELEARHGALPPTVIVTSRHDGSGIRLYRLPEGASSDGSRTGWPGIEILRHSHRYVVAPPSIHPKTGATYYCADQRSGEHHDVIPGIWQWSELPSAWLEALLPDVRQQTLERPAPRASVTSQTLMPCRAMQRRLDDALGALSNGTARHDSATADAFALLRLGDMGHSGAAVALAMLGNQFISAISGDRAGGRNEADREWRSIVNTAQAKIASDPTPSDRQGCCTDRDTIDLRELIAPALEPISDAYALAVDPEPAVERTSWWPVDLTGVLTGVDPEPEPTMLERVDGARLIYSCKVNGLLGESESGKTWIALLCVAQTLRRGQRVLYLDFEDSAAGIISRLRALGVSDEQLELFHYVSPDESLHLAAKRDLGEAVASIGAELIVLDGYNAAMTLLGLDLMSNTDATKFSQTLLKPLADTGAAVLYVDHLTKSKETRGKGGIGAQAKRAMTTGAAILVEVSRPFGRGQRGALRLTVDKDRPGYVRAASRGAGYVGTAHLQSDSETGAVIIEISLPDETERAAWRPTGYMERISTFLATMTEGASQKAIEEAVTGKREHIRAALDVLVDEGFVARQTGARGAIVHLRLRPYYEFDDVHGGDDDDF